MTWLRRITCIFYSQNYDVNIGLLILLPLLLLFINYLFKVDKIKAFVYIYAVGDRLKININ